MKKICSLIVVLLCGFGLFSCGDNRTKVVFWHSFGASITEVLEELKDEYMETNKDVKIVMESQGGYDNLKKAIVNNIITGNTPTMAIGYPDHFAEYISGNVMVPLDYFLAVEDENFLDDFVSDYLPENQSFGDDKIYGLPFNKSTEVLIYNKSFFDYYKLDVPATWQEVETVSKKINEIVFGIIDDGGEVFNEETGRLIFDFTGVTKEGFAAGCYDSQANLFITTCRQWDGKYTERGETIETGKILFKDPKSVAGLTFFNDLGTAQAIQVPTFWDASYGSDAFTTLKCVFTIGSSAGVTYNIPSGGKFEVGVAPIPYNADNENGKYVISQGTNLCIFANSSEKERLAAWDFIKYLTSTEINTRFAMATGYLPVRTSGLNSEVYQNFLEYSGNDVSMKLKSQTAAVAFDYQEKKYISFVDSPFIGSANIRSQVESTVDSFILPVEGRMTVSDAINKAYDILSAFK